MKAAQIARDSEESRELNLREHSASVAVRRREIDAAYRRGRSEGQDGVVIAVTVAAVIVGGLGMLAGALLF